MRFRPCIDIHNGKVKQIVGGSLKDDGNQAQENFVSELNAESYALKYKADGLKGGHIILLNPEGSEYYEADVRQAEAALAAYPGGLMIGGGITAENAGRFLDMGASHVIVTSYVFKDGILHVERLKKLVEMIGKERITLDLSCRRCKDTYYIVTDRWQKFTQMPMNEETLDALAPFCDEFLVHAVDVEGKAGGIEEEVAALLGHWGKAPVTYAGGVSSQNDVEKLRILGRGRLDVTIGSALDIFGGEIAYAWAAALR